MNYPFPGMDPYLEHPILWEGVHARLIVAIANQLQPKLDPRYIASIEERVFIEGPQRRIPDVWIQKIREDRGLAPLVGGDADTAVIVEVDDLEIREARVEILDSYHGMKLVALIEVVSPTNKAAGPGLVQGEATRDTRSGLSPGRDRPAPSGPPRPLHPRLAGEALEAVRFPVLHQPMDVAEPIRALSAHAATAVPTPANSPRRRGSRRDPRPASRTGTGL